MTDFAALDLVAGVAERAKSLAFGSSTRMLRSARKRIFGLRLTPVAVPAGRPELPADLEGDGGLARPRAEGEQRPLPALQRRLNGAVDGDLLVVAKGLRPVRKRGRQQPLGYLVIDECPPRAQAGPEIVGRREIPDRPLDPGRVVEFDDLNAIGGIRELQAEDFGIFLGLLKTLRRMPVAGLGLDNRDREVRIVSEEVVRALLLAAAGLAADKDDPAVGEGSLLVDGMGTIIPACSLQLRDDELPTGIGFVHAQTTSLSSDMPPHGRPPAKEVA